MLSQPWGRILLTQLLIAGVSLFLALVYPIVHGVILSAYEGLILQMLPPDMFSTTPIKPEPIVNRNPTTWEAFWPILRLAIIFDVFLLNPAVFFIRRQIKPLDTTAVTDGLIIGKMRLCAVLLRFTAVGVLGLIIGLLTVGLLIFISADRIATDPNEPAPARSMRSSSAGLPIDERTNLIEGWMRDIERDIEALKSRPKPAPQPARTDTQIMVSTLTTRVGAALMLWFLVYILIQLYRYNIKLAAFYDGRADALQLRGSNELAELEKTISLVSAERITFTDPKTPIEAALAPIQSTIKSAAQGAKSLADGVKSQIP